MRTLRLASILTLLAACSSHPAPATTDAPTGGGSDAAPPADAPATGGDGSGSSGGTAITLTLSGRPDTPAAFSFLVAYQDGTGAWQLAPAPTGDVYTFDVSSPTYGVAWTCVTSGAAARSVSLYELAVADRTSLTIDVPSACTDHGGAQVALDGTITSAPVGGRLDVGFGGITATATTGATTTYALQIPPATRDLLVGQESATTLGGNLVIAKAAALRGVAATGATTTKDVDFSAAQATQTATVSITRGTGQTAIASTTLYSAGGTVFPLALQTNAASYQAIGLAGALSQTGDVYDQQIEVDGNGAGAIVQHWVDAVANQTYTAPTPLGMPTTTVAAQMPYPQLHTTWSAYTGAVGYAWSATQALTGTACGAGGGSCTVTWSEAVSAGAAGASPSVAMPDLSALAGWDHALELKSGTAVNGSLAAATSSAGAGDFPPAMPAAAGTQRVLVSATWTATP